MQYDGWCSTIGSCKRWQDSPRGYTLVWSQLWRIWTLRTTLCCCLQTPAHPRQYQQTANQDGHQVGLNKTKTITLNVDMSAPVKVNGEKLCQLGQEDHFIYLSSIIKPEDGTKEVIHSKLGKARSVTSGGLHSAAPTPSWSYIRAVLYQLQLLYGLTWMLENDRDRSYQIFLTTCLQPIYTQDILAWEALKTCWADVIKRTWVPSLPDTNGNEKGRCYVQKDSQSTTSLEQHCNLTPEGKRKRGRRTWWKPCKKLGRSACPAFAKMEEVCWPSS